MVGTPRAWIAATATLALVLSGCMGGGAAFVDVAEERGIRYLVDKGLTREIHPMALLGGGVAVGDVDDDGWPDVYVVDRGPNALYINDGEGSFTDRTDAWNAGDDGVGRSPALFDYDNDGDLDLLVGNFATPTRLYRNDGGAFTDVTEEAGIDVDAEVFTTAIADVDGNGYLDVFLGVYGDIAGTQATSFSTAENGKPNHLLINQGDGTFTDETRDRGLRHTRWTLASAFHDADQDGDPDLYVANDFGWDAFFINDGNGTFTDRGHQLDARVNRNGMGVDFLDHDLDGDHDIYVGNIFVPDSTVPVLQGNVLYERHDEEGTYEDVSFQAGVADGGWAWDVEAMDIDNDLDEDLYVTNGFSSKADWDLFYDGEFVLERKSASQQGSGGGSVGYGLIDGNYNDTHKVLIAEDSLPPGTQIPAELTQEPISQGGYQNNRFFLNQGDGTFEDRAAELNTDLIGDSRTVAVLDHDRDGDLDMIVTATLEPVHLLENRMDTGNHWLQIHLDPGEDRYADAIGAHLEATVGDTVLVREMQGAAGFLGQSEPMIHLGLGEATQVDELTVTWPWGEQTTRTDVPADQRLTLSP